MYAPIPRRWGRSQIALALPGVVLLALCLWGCETSSSSGPVAVTTDQTPLPEPLEHPMLKGIPVPTGFRIVQDHSQVRHRGSMRDAQCEFQGTLIPSEVARFYEHYMPTAHFKLGPKIYINGEYTLRFESNNEECNVLIRPKGSKTILIIDVGPLWKGEPEPEPRPTPPQP